jgi:hypothetical protein
LTTSIEVTRLLSRSCLRGAQIKRVRLLHSLLKEIQEWIEVIDGTGKALEQCFAAASFHRKRQLAKDWLTISFQATL